MSDGVDTAVQDVQTPVRPAVRDRRIRQSQLTELAVRDDAVLAPRGPCDPSVERHVDPRRAETRFRPLRGPPRWVSPGGEAVACRDFVRFGRQTGNP